MSYRMPSQKMTRIVRSELTDSTRQENKRERNRLSKEFEQLERAQRVLTNDLDKQRHMMDLTLSKSLSPSSSHRRGDRPYLSSGLGYNLVTSSPTWEHYGTSPRPAGHNKLPRKAPTNTLPKQQASKYARGFVPGSRRTSLPIEPDDLERYKENNLSRTMPTGIAKIGTGNKSGTLYGREDIKTMDEQTLRAVLLKSRSLKQPLWTPKQHTAPVKGYKDRVEERSIVKKALREKSSGKSHVQ